MARPKQYGIRKKMLISLDLDLYEELKKIKDIENSTITQIINKSLLKYILLYTSNKDKWAMENRKIIKRIVDKNNNMDNSIEELRELSGLKLGIKNINKVLLL